jgi:hypothetical protein
MVVSYKTRCKARKQIDLNHSEDEMKQTIFGDRQKSPPLFGAMRNWEGNPRGPAARPAPGFFRPDPVPAGLATSSLLR